MGCGGDESGPPSGTPTAGERIPVGCIAKWTSGESGTFSCTGGGPRAAQAKITPETIHLDQACVNDPRLTTITAAGGKTIAVPPGPSPTRCVQLGGAQHLPERCTCVPPAGGDCTPPEVGFVCVAAGYVQH